MAQKDDDLIIIEDDDNIIDLDNADLINLDTKQPEEIISFEETNIKTENTQEKKINTEDNEILDFNLDLGESEEINLDLGESEEINLDLGESGIKKEVILEKIEPKEESSNFDLESLNQEKKITEEIFGEVGDLNSILEGAIVKLATRKKIINKKIDTTMLEISKIETEVKKLQNERKNFLSEVKDLNGENIKIDENVKNLEKMKI